MGTLNTALMSVASHAGGPSLVHTDLDCDRIAEVCDQTCQEAALEALAGAASLRPASCFRKFNMRNSYRCPSDNTESQSKTIRSVNVAYPTVITVDISMKRYPKSFSSFLFSEYRIIGCTPVPESSTLQTSVACFRFSMARRQCTDKKGIFLKATWKSERTSY
jgi:hypothetical protein